MLRTRPPRLARKKKTLKCAKPADLPVKQRSIFELAVNAKTAKSLGITFAPTLLFRVGKLIE